MSKVQGGGVIRVTVKASGVCQTVPSLTTTLHSVKTLILDSVSNTAHMSSDPLIHCLDEMAFKHFPQLKIKTYHI